MNIKIMAKEKDKNELVWQKALEKFVINKRPTFVSTSNKSINILSLGKHNCFEGPDFLKSCLSVDGELVVGDIEFHMKSSSWAYHKHSSNKKYSNVILHIVFDDDKKYFNASFETVLISRTSLIEYTNTPSSLKIFDYTSYDDFQEYAMFRLYRRAEDIFQFLQNYSITDTFIVFTTNFLNKYFSFRRRPSKLNLDITEIIEYFLSTSILQTILKINSLDSNTSQIFRSFLTSNSLGINDHLKQEIITNVFLPLMFCVANAEKKSELLLWYLSAKPKTTYGILTREFSSVKQEYIWLQQGMLEFIRRFCYSGST